ncbi:MAG: hypothetical protein ACREQ5_08035, partial [Candidatus Dormibacteria bacterium]
TAYGQANSAYGQANSAYGQANLAYTAANSSANMVATYANGTIVLTKANLNFNNTATINVTALANGTGQANISFSANASAIGAAGANTDVQFNDNGVFGGSPSLIWNKANNTLVVAGNVVPTYIIQPTLKAQREVYTNNGLMTANVNLDVSQGSFFDLMLIGNFYITLQNVASVGNTSTITIILRQSSNGSNTVSWSNTIRWSDNTQPVLTTTANTLDVIQLFSYNNGTFFIGSQIMANVPKANIY